MKKIDHLGIAVADLDAAEKIFTDVLGTSPYKRDVVESESVVTSFFKTGESKIELLHSTSEDGPIARHISMRGEGLHHIAFHVDNLEREISELESKGYRCISGPKDGADGKRIAFFHPSDTVKVLVELCEG